LRVFTNAAPREPRRKGVIDFARPHVVSSRRSEYTVQRRPITCPVIRRYGMGRQCREDESAKSGRADPWDRAVSIYRQETRRCGYSKHRRTLWTRLAWDYVRRAVITTVVESLIVVPKEHYTSGEACSRSNVSVHKRAFDLFCHWTPHMLALILLLSLAYQT
jgi:hypothetical protein